MKCFYSVLVLVAGLNIISAAAVPALKESVDDNLLIKEISEPVTQEVILSSNDVQDNALFNIIPDSTEKQPNFEETLNIVLENIKNPIEQFDVEEPGSNYEFSVQDPTDGSLDEIIPPSDADYYYSDVINRDPNEIMDTAAGFAPIPIFKRKQKRRKQVAARRRFRTPYSYRRHYYYYPYHSYYRPSLLRFYY